MNLITRSSIAQKAWPIILANAAVPTLGLADAAIIGNFGITEELAAIALGALIFNFIYWSFGFLRMSTTGFIAQAAGANDQVEITSSLLRPLLTAVTIGLFIIMIQWPLQLIIFTCFHSSESVESIAQQYFYIRIWGAPATLATFAFIGTLIGLGKTKPLLIVQLFLNGLNIILDYMFAGIFDMGPSGIALGTVIAEWSAAILSGFIIYRLLKDRQSNLHVNWVSVFHIDKIKKTLSSNSDIFIRTILLLFSFYWFTDQSARFGAETLAANHILLLIISFSAFFIDGFSFVTESLVGKAIGGNDFLSLKKAIRYSTELSLVSSSLLGFLFFTQGAFIISLLTDLDDVRRVAIEYLPFACFYIFISFAAFQLDGIFIGATKTKEMRNTSIFSVTTFLLSGITLVSYCGLKGLWVAFIIYIIIRALSLMLYLPSIHLKEKQLAV